MNSRNLFKTATGIIYLLSIISIVYGGMYLVKYHIMGYHEAFLGMSEDDLATFNPRIVFLFLVLMKITGAAFLSVGIGTFFICHYGYRKKENWAVWGLILSYFSALIPMFILTYQVASAIPAGKPQPPYWLTFSMIFLLVFALFLGKKELNRNR